MSKTETAIDVESILPLRSGRPRPSLESSRPLVWMMSTKSASEASKRSTELASLKQGCAGSRPATKIWKDD